MRAKDLIDGLNQIASPERAKASQWFFKTGKGQYGHGDKFIGVSMPDNRTLCKKYAALSLEEIEKLLESDIHEARMAGLIIMTDQAKKADEQLKQKLYDLYLRRTDRINNWDLIDISCRQVVGGYLENKPRDILYKLARSSDLWERRIAIVSTAFFISKGQLKDTFEISKLLLGDSHDLIHKAVGWMLRETGKKDRGQLLKFLDEYAYKMPRTALRYSIEHLPHNDRLKYMSAKSSLAA